jgi:hypothetical protein
MHALVGCQNRWINSLARCLHSLAMINALFTLKIALSVVSSTAHDPPNQL